MSCAFGARKELLARRVERQREIDAGRMPDFLPETAAIRGGDGRFRRRAVAGSPHRNHQPGRSQDGDQRVELRGALLDGGLRGWPYVHAGLLLQINVCRHGAYAMGGMAARSSRTSGGGRGRVRECAPTRSARRPTGTTARVGTGAGGGRENRGISKRMSGRTSCTACTMKTRRRPLHADVESEQFDDSCRCRRMNCCRDGLSAGAAGVLTIQASIRCTTLMPTLAQLNALDPRPSPPHSTTLRALAAGGGAWWRRHGLRSPDWDCSAMSASVRRTLRDDARRVPTQLRLSGTPISRAGNSGSNSASPRAAGAGPTSMNSPRPSSPVSTTQRGLSRGSGFVHHLRGIMTGVVAAMQSPLPSPIEVPTALGGSKVAACGWFVRAAGINAPSWSETMRGVCFPIMEDGAHRTARTRWYFGAAGSALLRGESNVEHNPGNRAQPPV